jgi:hypothetical protein
MFTQLWRMALPRTGRVQWASRDTISQPVSLPIAKASMPSRSFSRASTARFVESSMNGLPRKPGCARPRCPRDHLTQADRHIAEANGSRELCPLCRTTKITRGICIISAIADSGAGHAHRAVFGQFRIRSRDQAGHGRRTRNGSRSSSARRPKHSVGKNRQKSSRLCAAQNLVDDAHDMPITQQLSRSIGEQAPSSALSGHW